MTENAPRTQDDTVERGLADDLLGSGDRSDAQTESLAPVSESAASTRPGLGDDDDYLAPAARRGKLTTVLLVALIFLVGVLVGTVLTKTLSPAPAPQIVYVLNSATPTPPATPASPR